MEKVFDVVALGELLIDFTESGESPQGNPLLEANPGGAPCNVLAMLAKLGDRTGFIGKIGQDQFGKMLKKKVSDLGIDTTFLYEDENVHTTLAFVHTNKKDGERDFSFYRNPGADMMLEEREIPEALIKKAKIFHFGTLSMTHEGVRNATKKALDIAKKSNCLISFDPNIRFPLWESEAEAREQVVYGLQRCDILKISDDEIGWFSGEDNLDEGIKMLNEQFNIPLIFLSMGANGSRAYYKDLRVEVAAFIQKETKETTGAGDTFEGCVLHFINAWGMDELRAQDFVSMLTFANAASSIITTKKGALSVMPTICEVEKLLKKNKQCKDMKNFDERPY